MSGVRRKGGVSLIQAFLRKTGTSRLDVKGEIQVAETIRMRVLMQGTGAGLFVVVMKSL
jgi:hypothetical protein